jgi:hypothetical protein
VKREVVSTSFGCTSECRGVRRTSSKVRTMSLRTRDRSSVGSVPLMRESPLPDLSGLAGFFDVDGRVVVAIAKGMAWRGLRPEAGYTLPPEAAALVIAEAAACCVLRANNGS